jgi:hypothetical protein
MVLKRNTRFKKIIKDRLLEKIASFKEVAVTRKLKHELKERII